MISEVVSTSPPSSLLERYEKLQSTDLTEVRIKVGRVFCEHELRVIGRAQRLDTRLCYRTVGQLGFGRIHYGAAVDINPGALDDFFLLQMPTCGYETITMGNHVVESTSAVASLISPTLPFRMRHGEGTDKLFIRIERPAMERQFRQMYARPLSGALEFLPDIKTSLAPGADLRRLVDWFFSEASEGSLLTHPLVAARIEETLMATMLSTLPHNQTAALQHELTVVSPRFVVRAQEYMEQHAHEPLTAGAIAAHVGISVRSLFVGFRKYRDTTPMAYLKNVRLDKVRAELLAAPAARGSVTRAASRWGFSHFGQFSSSYRQRFGELPSQTVIGATGP